MAAPMKRVEALNRLTQSLNAVEGPTASALRLAGSSEKDYNDAMLRVVQSIDNRRGLIGKIPRANANIGIKPNANQSAKGKLILNYIESGFNRYLLSIDICIVLLRAKNVDLEDVKPALNFVDTLKNFYETLCSFVVDVPTNNAKVGSVKGALDSLLAVPIPARIMNTLNGVGGEAKNGNAGGFTEYTARVKVAVTAASAAIAAAKIEPNNATNAFGFGPPAAAAAAAAAANEAAAIAAAGQPPAGAAAAAAAALPRNNPLNVRANPPPPGTDASRRAAYDIATKALKEEAAARAAARQVPAAAAAAAPPLAQNPAIDPNFLKAMAGEGDGFFGNAGANQALMQQPLARLPAAGQPPAGAAAGAPLPPNKSPNVRVAPPAAPASAKLPPPPPPPALAQLPAGRAAQEERVPDVISFKKAMYQYKVGYGRKSHQIGDNDFIAESVVLKDNLTINTINDKTFAPNSIVSKVVISIEGKEKITIPGPFKKTPYGSLLYFTENNNEDLRKVQKGQLVKTTIYTIPKPMPGGRRRTKAKSKASRKTKRRSTRRNRRS
jgi:hypothetical protein